MDEENIIEESEEWDSESYLDDDDEYDSDDPCIHCSMKDCCDHWEAMFCCTRCHWAGCDDCENCDPMDI